MRRMTPPNRDDSGVATLIVIGMIPVLLLMVAAGIDLNRYSQENSSAQHSADATALAVATDCALSGNPLGTANYGEYRKAGQAVSDSTPISCGSGEVRIKIEKDVNSGLIFDRQARVVQKDATVKWGPLGSANTLPVAVASCELPAKFNTSVETVLYFDDTPSQFGCSSPSGGFSLLAGTGCEVLVSSDGYADGKTGNELNADEAKCLQNETGDLPHTVLIPVYDFDTCVEEECKGKGPYLIRGFAAFKVTGYSLRGNFKAGTLADGCPDGNGATNCLQGFFTSETLSDGTPCNELEATCEDFGVTLVYLYS